MLALEAITLSWWYLLAEHAPSAAGVIVQDHTAPGRGGSSQPFSLQQCDRQNTSLQDGLGCQPAKPIWRLGARRAYPGFLSLPLWDGLKFLNCLQTCFSHRKFPFSRLPSSTHWLGINTFGIWKWGQCLEQGREWGSGKQQGTDTCPLGKLQTSLTQADLFGEVAHLKNIMMYKLDN